MMMMMMMMMMMTMNQTKFNKEFTPFGAIQKLRHAPRGKG